MYLGCEASFTASQSFVLGVPPLPPHSSALRWDGGVYDDAFHIGVGSEVLKHCRPDAAFGPTVKPLVNTVPIAVFFGKESPAGRPGRTLSAKSGNDLKEPTQGGTGTGRLNFSLPVPPAHQATKIQGRGGQGVLQAGLL